MIEKHLLKDEIMKEIKDLEEIIIKLNLYVDTSEVFTENYKNQTLTNKKLEIIAQNYKEYFKKLIQFIKKHERINLLINLYEKCFIDNIDENENILDSRIKGVMDSFKEDYIKRVNYFGNIIETLIKSSFSKLTI